MKLTIKEVNEKLQLINQISQKENDKLTYAIKKLYSKVTKAMEEKRADVQNRIADLHLEHASIDEKGLLREKDGQYQYSKEDKVKLVQAVRDLNKEYDKTTIDFEPFQVGIDQAPRILDLDPFIIDEVGDILFTSATQSSSEKIASIDVPPGKTYPPPPVKI